MFLCAQCPKSFLDKKRLQDHQRNHIVIKSTCEICQKTYLSKQSFIAHKATHKSSLFSCEECGKTFKHKSSLGVHQKLHYGGISCPFCDKLFQRKEYLKIHFVNCKEAIRGDLQNFEKETEILLEQTVEKEIKIKQEVPDLVENEYIEFNDVEYVDEEVNMEQEEFKLPELDEIKICCQFCKKEVKDIAKHMKTHTPKIVACHILDV